jgi:hypothetical protein
MYPQGPGFCKNASSSFSPDTGFHPFGSQASVGNPPAHGFAPRPYDRFAFFEDEEAADLIRATFRL